MKPIRLLLVDDDASLRKVLAFKLGKQGYRIEEAGNGQEALDKISSSRFDLILSDMRMPLMSGLELLEAVKAVQPEIEVILMTAFADVSQAVQAVKKGAFDYLTKPFEDDELFVAIEKAVKFRRLEQENKTLKAKLQSRSELEPVGVSRSIRAVLSLVDKIAPSDATVLIAGPSGSGKELIARMIHRRSTRSERPFVAVNCAAIPRDLIESELFGHVKGAFTGAIRNKRGKFEQADGGTLLLDEISELGIELQAKLLRVVQERIVEPVGSESKIEVDVRLLAATNVDLKQKVARGEFREDLFYRLNVIPLAIPPLSERTDDIPSLVKTFLGRYAPDADVTISPELLEALTYHDWPGNIRELENLIERMTVLRQSDQLTLSDLPLEYRSSLVSESGDVMASGSPVSLADGERGIVVNALKRASWNKSKAASLLKVPRHILLYRMKKYSIIPPEKK